MSVGFEFKSREGCCSINNLNVRRRKSRSKAIAANHYCAHGRASDEEGGEEGEGGTLVVMARGYAVAVLEER